MGEVKVIFEPQKVVLIGSSKIREKVGMTSPRLFKSVIYNVRKFFRGKTYVLDMDGKTGYNKLSKLPKLPELAVIMLPPEQSIEQSEKCARIGVKALVVITGGYNDEQRQQLLKLREEYGTRILGPNTTMGVINTANGLNTTFERNVMPKKGNIAVISQSGGVGACVLDWTCFYKIGVSKIAFVGDKIDVDDVDLLRHLGNDKDTKVICLYMEGIKNGRKFIEEARRTVKKKPVLALKSGTTQESARRAKSHTASIAGSDEIFDAAFKKAGIIRVKDIEELMNAATALSKQPPMRGDNVANEINCLHEFVESLPEGCQTDVGERGARLSVGQRQLISFARALLRNPKILILDEATSSIDPYTELKIKKGLTTLLKDRTSLVIAHRLSTVRNADHIIVLNEGKIVEEGTHVELMKKKGLYRRLYEKQFRDT